MNNPVSSYISQTEYFHYFQAMHNLQQAASGPLASIEIAAEDVFVPAAPISRFKYVWEVISKFFLRSARTQAQIETNKKIAILRRNILTINQTHQKLAPCRFNDIPYSPFNENHYSTLRTGRLYREMEGTFKAWNARLEAPTISTRIIQAFNRFLGFGIDNPQDLKIEFCTNDTLQRFNMEPFKRTSKSREFISSVNHPDQNLYFDNIPSFIAYRHFLDLFTKTGGVKYFIDEEMQLATRLINENTVPYTALFMWEDYLENLWSVYKLKSHSNQWNIANGINFDVNESVVVLKKYVEETSNNNIDICFHFFRSFIGLFPRTEDNKDNIEGIFYHAKCLFSNDQLKKTNYSQFQSWLEQCAHLLSLLAPSRERGIKASSLMLHIVIPYIKAHPDQRETVFQFALALLIPMGLYYMPESNEEEWRKEIDRKLNPTQPAQ